MSSLKFKNWIILILFIFSLASGMSLNAETKPRWVTKGAEELNKQRTNDTYSFHVFHLQDERKSAYEYDAYGALKSYVASTYSVPENEVTIDELETADGEVSIYIAGFVSNGQPEVIYAKLVDSFKKFEDYPDGSSDYNVWQLFAISEPDVYPDFDEFIIKDKYSMAPLGMSIIPGLGQIYKGQKAKGYTLLGVEAAMVASIIFATTQANHWNNLAYKHPEVFDSYQSKADSFRAWRTFCFIAGGGLYVYNLLDAALSKGARYIQIKRKNEPAVQVSLFPSVTLDSPGFTIGLRF